MAITSVGYAGSITDDNWRRMATATVGSLYGVDDYASWKVSTGTGDRGIRVAPGGAFGLGVRDVSDAAVNLNGGVVATDSRWDLVVARRNWGTKVTTIVIIPGTANKALPARNTGYGAINDQPLALVRFAAGQTAVQEIIDLRCIPGDGGIIAFDGLARSYLDRVGTVLTIKDVVWTRTIDANGSPTWTSTESDSNRFEGRIRRSDGSLALNTGQTLFKWQTITTNTLGATPNVNAAGTVLSLAAGHVYMVTASLKVAVGAQNFSQITIANPGGIILGGFGGEMQTPAGFYELSTTRIIYANDTLVLGIQAQSNNAGSIREDGIVRVFRLR